MSDVLLPAFQHVSPDGPLLNMVYYRYLCVVLIQEVDDANIIFESDDVGFGEGHGRRQISRRGIYGTKKVLGKADGIDLSKINSISGEVG